VPLKTLLFGFHGRIRRRDWWIWSLASAVVWTAATLALGAALFGRGWAAGQLGTGPFTNSWPAFSYGFLVYLPMLWLQSALAAKRSHDRDKPASLAVGLTVLSGLVSFVPEVVDLATGYRLTDAEFARVADPVRIGSAGVNLYLVALLGVLDGTRGPNRYGPSPKGIGGDATGDVAEVFS